LCVLESIERSKMPSLYRAADIFTIGSLREMLGTVLLEALSTGLPVTCHRTPILEWVAGPTAVLEDISEPGGLVRQWCALLDPTVRSTRSAAARAHAEGTFSQAVILKQVLEMYSAVMADRPCQK
jgi:glycosyltransferase involved in cell wall biosynthesis